MNSPFQELNPTPITLLSNAPLIILFILSRFCRRLPYPPGPKGGPAIRNMNVVNHMVAVSSAEIAISYVTYNRTDMALAHYGTIWRRMLELCVVKLFSRKRAESWDPVRDEVDHRTHLVAQNTSSLINPEDADSDMDDYLLAFYSDEVRIDEQAE